MADSRRRTLANTQAGSGIPVPSSAARPSARQSLAASHSTNAARQSLAPARLGASRQSMAPALSQEAGGSQGSQMFSQGHGGPPREAPATVGRSSMYTSLGAMSASRNAGVLRSGGAQTEYAPPSERRTSTYRRSMGGAAATTPIGGYSTHLISRPVKDLRDVRSSAARQRNANFIIEYLSSVGFGADTKMLLTPTAKDFQNIFKFLIAKLDPGFRFGGQGKKFEEEVIPALRTILYPFPDSITKSHLQSIGSQQSWPNMLAMLHWIVVLIKSKIETFLNSPDLHMPAHVDDADASPDYASHAWLDYVGETYPQFLADDHFDPAQSRELEIYYERIDPHREALHAKVEETRASHEAKRKTLAALRAEPDPLALVTRETEKLTNDADSVDKYTTSLALKVAGGRSQINMLFEKEAELKLQAAATDSERAQLTAQVELQGISPVEIQNMNSERTNLQQALAQANQKQETILKKSYDLEIDLQRGLENTAQLCATYELKATAIGVLPTPPEGYEHVNFTQELNGAADNPVPDCQTLLRPALLQLKAKAKAECSKLNEDDVILEEKITRTKETIAELKESFEADEMEMDQADKDVQDAKEAASIEFGNINAEMDRLQSSVNHINSSMHQGLMTAQAHFDQRAIEREDAQEVATRVLREQHEAFETMIDHTLTYRSYLMDKATELYALTQETT